MTVRVRFAPSPSGHLHVGGARTALFNWLFARKKKGSFILRIEDTDSARSKAGMVESILDAVSWMGLDWDEGPYYQSDRIERYRTLATQLLEDKQAYHCFCSPEALASRRQDGTTSKVGWKYDRKCLLLDKSEVRDMLDRGAQAAIRFKVPDESVQFNDGVFGMIEVNREEIEDFVLLRSDGQPTYHLSVVADDIEMEISHVIRGADHISNTPKQLLLYRALGVRLPEFIHVPLILGPDRHRMSKRHGATSVLAYRDDGISPEAFRNFLALLGWSPGNDQEIFTKQELITGFSVKGISKANAVFDAEKLWWFGGQHLNNLDLDELAGRLRPLLQDFGLWQDVCVSGGKEWFSSLIRLIRPRFRSMRDLAHEIGVYAVDAVSSYESKAVDKFLKDPSLANYLLELASRLENLDTFDLEQTESVLRTLADELGIKAGLLINASRVSLTGKGVAPGIFDVMVALGAAKTVARLRQSVTEIFGS